MSKRKPALVSKHAARPKEAAKAQQAAQAILRGRKDDPLRLVAVGSPEPSSESRNDPKQTAPLVENPATAPQDDLEQTTSDNDSKKGFVFSSATANVVRNYQAKLLKMAHDDMQFAFEFAERLAAIRSPVEFPRVIADFTSKRIAMFMDHSKEIAELSKGRRAP